MDELLAQFLIEGRDLVAQATADFEILAQTADKADAIDSAFRAVHTLKGSVAIFAFSPAEALLHAAEDVLALARKHASPIPPSTLQALLAAIDCVDGWIDEIERSGGLPPTAEAEAAVLIDQLGGFANSGKMSQPAKAADVVPASDGWGAAFLRRHENALEGATGVLSLFRYRPDPDCFFRGEDPLAIAMAVPDLVHLQLLPIGDAWPEPETLEPFACIARLEGASTAPIDAVRAAFRLVPDQVESLSIERSVAADNDRMAVARNDVLRVEAGRVDRLADGLGELIVAVNALARVGEDAVRSDPALGASLRTVQSKLEQVAGRLHRDVSAVRAVPMAHALRRLPRLVREIAIGLGKEIDFTVEGDGIEVDKQIADALFEPLLHLLRNAVDHGAEPPAERVDAGKARACAIRLRFERAGDRIVAQLADDGRGIDSERVRAIAVTRGLLDADAAAGLDQAAARRLIFLPGFSSADTVTATSGRGVGMDAVQDVVERLRGSVDLQSEVGRGTVFELTLPVSALTTRLLVVNANGERYGLSLDQITETARVDAGELKPIGSGTAFILRGRTLPVVALTRLLGGPAPEGNTARLVVTAASGERVALRVDGFGERLDAFVRPASGLLASVPAVSGSTVLGDGSVMLILDLAEILA